MLCLHMYYWEVTSDHRSVVPLQKASILSAGLVSSLNETTNTYQNNVRLLQGCTLSLYAHLLACDILQILDQNVFMVINRYLILQSPINGEFCLSKDNRDRFCICSSTYRTLRRFSLAIHYSFSNFKNKIPMVLHSRIVLVC